MNQSIVTQSLPPASHYSKRSSAEKIAESGKRSINPPIKRLNLSQGKSQTEKAAIVGIQKGEGVSPQLTTHRGSIHSRLFTNMTSAAFTKSKPTIQQYATTLRRQTQSKEETVGTPKQTLAINLTTFTAKKPQRSEQKLI